MKMKKFLVITLVVAMIFSTFTATSFGATSNKKTISGVQKTTVKLSTETSLTSAGKAVIKLKWSKSAGYKVDYYQVFRSTKKTTGYGTKAYYTTKKSTTLKYTDTKATVGKTYYYKVRGVKKIAGKKYYTKWSNISSKKSKYPVADSVYYNANIYTVNDKSPKAKAIAVKGDKILYVGTDKIAKKLIGSKTKTVDVEGKTMLPGIMEGHMHFGYMGQTMMSLQIFWKPKDYILNLVKEAAENSEPGTWIRGSGWMNTIWEDNDYPTKEDLDAVAPNNPVLLTRADGHMSWVNSLAFELAGITKDTPNPQGGEYVKKPNGELWGVLTDNAAAPIQAIIPGFTQAQTERMYLLAQDECFKYGITSEMDAGVSVSAINTYKKLYEEGSLKIRSYPLIRLTADTANDQAEYVRNVAPEGMLFDNRMNIRAVKITTDGSLGARSAAMLEDYSDRPGYKGELMFTDEQSYDIFKNAWDHNYQICTHTIGDAGARQVINTVEKLAKENPKDDHRCRIEHFQIVTLDDMDRAFNLGIIPSMQFIHATSDLLMAEDRIGKERMSGAYAWRTVLNKGANIVGGTDAPIESVNPWHNFYAGVTRMAKDGYPIDGWYVDEALTREEVLNSYTKWVAYGQFEENLKGSLEQGKLADFVILDRNIMTVPAEEMMNVNALTTVVGGEEVYNMNTERATINFHGTEAELNSDVVKKDGIKYVPVLDLATGISATYEKDGDTAVFTYDGDTVKLPIERIGNVDCVDMYKLFTKIGQHVVYYKTSNSYSVTKAGVYDEFH